MAQGSLKAIHRRFPFGIDGSQFGRNGTGPVFSDLGDHEQAIAGAPDLHGQEALGADRRRHFRPDAPGGVGAFIVCDQGGVVDQIERKADAFRQNHHPFLHVGF